MVYCIQLWSPQDPWIVFPVSHEWVKSGIEWVNLNLNPLVVHITTYHSQVVLHEQFNQLFVCAMTLSEHYSFVSSTTEVIGAGSDIHEMISPRLHLYYLYADEDNHRKVHYLYGAV